MLRRFVRGRAASAGKSAAASRRDDQGDRSRHDVAVIAVVLFTRAKELLSQKLAFRCELANPAHREAAAIRLDRDICYNENMSSSFLFSLSALAAMLPAAVYGLLTRDDGDSARGRFWALLAVALAGTLTWTYARFSTGWHTGFAASLWLTISVTLVLFAGLVLVASEARKLGVLLLPYLSVLAVLALLWERAPERALAAPLGSWALLHIAMSILAYALATLAAVAATGVILRERALKSKARGKGVPGATPLSGLPAVADGERLQTRLLSAAAILLAAGLASGMATQIVEFGAWLPLNHKVILAFIAFAVVITLLVLHLRFGLPGRRAARVLLAAYLLLSLAYPGVKFVTDVLITAG